MASQQMREVVASLRAQRAVSQTGTGTVADMRAGFEPQQSGLPIPAEVDALDITVAGRPARRIRTPSPHYS